MTCVYDTLNQRGFVEQQTDDLLRDYLAGDTRTLYLGIDPTASSLHVGHLVAIMGLSHFQRAGHRVLVVVGGATGLIGDPSGRSDERKLLTLEEVAANAACVKHQIARFLDFTGANGAMMLDNYDWISSMTVIDWLRDVGKHFTVNTMLGKESVRSRLEGGGISFAEFAYLTLQAFDFLYLFDHYDTTVQAGGSDQFGNIVAGIELIRRVRGGQAYGLTFPLVTTASGEKIGKSLGGGSIWLDPERTSPYKFYQYWMQTDDADMERCLKLFTYLTAEEIARICEEHARTPERRDAQRQLARQATLLVHGTDGLARAEKAAETLFGREVSGLTDQELTEVFADVPSTICPMARLGDGLSLVDMLITSGLASSRGDARRRIEGNGVYVNNRRIADSGAAITPRDLASETMLILRLGKRQYHLVRFG